MVPNGWLNDHSVWHFRFLSVSRQLFHFSQLARFRLKPDPFSPHHPFPFPFPFTPLSGFMSAIYSVDLISLHHWGLGLGLVDRAWFAFVEDNGTTHGHNSHRQDGGRERGKSVERAAIIQMTRHTIHGRAYFIHRTSSNQVSHCDNSKSSNCDHAHYNNRSSELDRMTVKPYCASSLGPCKNIEDWIETRIRHPHQSKVGISIL